MSLQFVNDLLGLLVLALESAQVSLKEKDQEQILNTTTKQKFKTFRVTAIVDKLDS